MARRETADQMAAFESWYENNRQFSAIAPKLAINLRTLYGWADRYAWADRADERDRKALAKAEPRSIQRTAKLLEDQQKAGQLLRAKAIKFFLENEIIDARSAIMAIKTGIELERQALGLPDYVTEILNAPPEQLDDIVERMERRRRASLPDSESAAE